MIVNTEAEQKLLGCCFYPQTWDSVFAEVRTEMFGLEPHRLIYRAMSELGEIGLDVEPLAVRDRLGSDIHQVGGMDCLVSLASEADPLYLDVYIHLVRSAWVKRSLDEQAQAIRRMCADPEVKPEECVAAASALSEISGNVASSPFVKWREIDMDSDDQGVTTGFAKLDERSGCGGYPKGQNTIVSAYHKGGKSTFMLSSFIHQANKGLKVVYATFADLSAQRLKRRAMRNLMGWSKRPEIDMLLADEYDQLVDGMDKDWRVGVYNAVTGGYDVESFCAWFRSLTKRQEIDCCYVDYAQRLTSSDRKATSVREEQNICSRKLSRLAEETGVAIVIGSQITEGKDGQKAITKESRGWEEDAGWVLRLKRENETDATVEIAYSRFGPMDIFLPFRWNAERLRFEEK